MKVGKERAEAHRHSETEFNKEIFHVLLVDAALKAVQALQETGQQGKELLVQQLVASCGGEGRGGEGRKGSGGREGGRVRPGVLANHYPQICVPTHLLRWT